MHVSFGKGNYTFSVYNIHTKPDDVLHELGYLESVVFDKDNTVIIGDLNADCSYYDNDVENAFDEWHWIIQDYHDTTSGKSDCAYDRILVEDDAYADVIAAGIWKKGIVKEISDHYLVWVQLAFD